MIFKKHFFYRLRFQDSAVVFQEVPNEISLALSVSGCPHHCPDCHSKYLWKDVGDIVMKKLPDLLTKYDSWVTCVCFMGGDHRQEELRRILEYCKERGFKTCLYTGLPAPSSLRVSLLEQLDYLKTGPFDKARGPLSSPATNQRFYEVRHNPHGALILEDKTYLFRNAS